MNDDLISRQAAIDALRDAENHAFSSYYQGLKKAHKIIANLPSAQPERKKGNEKCSNELPCGWCSLFDRQWFGRGGEQDGQ